MKTKEDNTPKTPADSERSTVVCSDLLGRFGQRVKIARVLRAMSMRDLAARMGITVAAVSKAEQGRMFGSRNLIKLSEAVDLPLDWFFSDDPAYLGQPLKNGTCPKHGDYYA